MKRASKLFFTGPMTFSIGFLALLLGILLITKSNNLSGAFLLLVGALFLTYRVGFIIDPDKSIIICMHKILFMNFRVRTIRLSSAKGSIVLIHSTNELYGINKKASTFFTHDVIYKKGNNHTIDIFTSTNKSQAIKTAEFLSSHLNLALEQKSIQS